MNVTYISACLDSSGYAEAARNHIAALDSVGVNVNVVPISFEGYRSDLGRLGAKVQDLIKRHHPGDIQILHMTPQNYNRMRDLKKYNIGYAAWETDRLPPDWVDLCNGLQEMWVPSTYNKTVFEESGVKVPIFVMPHPFDVEGVKEDEEKGNSVVANLSDEDFVFYSIFQWIERKNPVDLLKAYLTEFKPDEKVAMVLKTYLVNPNNPREAQSIREMIRDVKKKLYMKHYPKVLLISSLLSKNQIKTLHRQGDCYVSLHRCEGFGIPFAEAMLERNPVITTGYGGPTDFMTTQSLVNHMVTPVYGMPWKTYTGHMKWAQPDVMDARRLMREMFEDQKKAKEQGQAGFDEITQNLSWEKIGGRMKARLEEIAEDL